MIQICKEKLLNRGFVDVNYENTSIELFKPSGKKFDLITVAFGFRNFSDHKNALMNIFSCLETCGVFIIMDFKKPRNKVQSQLFDFYTLNIIPRIGKAVTGDQESYRYLAESIQTYFSPQEIKEMCENSMLILQLLSEEVFDFALARMTSGRIHELKGKLHEEFKMIFQNVNYEYIF